MRPFRLSLGRRRSFPVTRGLVRQDAAVISPGHRRGIAHDTAKVSKGVEAQSPLTPPAAGFDCFNKYFTYPAQSSKEEFELGSTVVVHGMFAGRRNLHTKLSFADVVADNGPTFQFTSKWDSDGTDAHALDQQLKNVPKRSAVAFTGRITGIVKREPHSEFRGYGNRFRSDIQRYELDLQAVQVLNPFPKDITISKDTVFPPKSRNLQLKFSKVLRNRLEFRAFLERKASDLLEEERLLKVETPLLFKSTPEGAREFIVPARRKGRAYALPQSPQQYKQILMSAGLRGYYQMARCFRDEDLRADRQPEFTQLDLELSYAAGKDVMELVERLARHLYSSVQQNWRISELDQEFFPSHASDVAAKDPIEAYPCLPEGPFPRLTYQEVMRRFGSDKPNLGIPGEIQRLDHMVPPSFVSMISGLDRPIVEAVKLRLEESSESPVARARTFVKSFWDKLPEEFAQNPDGQPAVLIVDSTKPLMGLSALQFEAADALQTQCTASSPLGELDDGNILIFQAREDKPFAGGSTTLGNLRIALHRAAVEQQLIKADRGFNFLWVTGFPMFTPKNDTDPGQGGLAGFNATHHPFTAPLAAKDFDLLTSDPLKAEADHYDLVLNGVELGGGSRRIHIAAMQEMIFRDILQMSEQSIAHFQHLLDALRAGCPPHAGFAFGWDRLVAMLSFTNSVRDVIAFPKAMSGIDLQTGSPGLLTPAQLETYHLAFAKSKTHE